MPHRLTSDITMGKFRFSGVHELRIRRTLHSYVDMAFLQLPSTARIIRKNGNQDAGIVQTGNQFADGEKATIKIGYNDTNYTEFEGFVKRRNFNQPFEIEFEGYSYQLRQKKVSGFWKKIAVKDFLAIATAGTDVTLRCDADMDLYNIRITDGCALDMLDAVMKASGQALSMFFLQPRVLYCGLIYTAYSAGTDLLGLGAAKFQLGYNCPKDNQLRQRIVTNDPVIVHFVKKNSKGEKLSGKSNGVKELNNRLHRKILNHIGTASDLQKLAEEKQQRINYEGYEGSLTGFGWPNVQPGFMVYIKQRLFPERDGNYLVDGINIEFGVRGFRRHIEIQHRVS